MVKTVVDFKRNNCHYGNMKKFPTIYKRTSGGKIQVWTIIAGKDSYHTEEGVQGGKVSVNKPHTVEPKNVGKANETSAEEQAEIEALAKWEKKLKTGYAKSVAEIDSVAFKKPMKGYKWKEQYHKVKFPVTYQDKLNGVRYQAEDDASRSTGGEIFYTTPHIREALRPIFDAYPGIFLDGEVFNFKLKQHLNRLTEIVNVNITPKDTTPELLEESREIVQFHVFDTYGFEGISKETPWEQRYAALAKVIKKFAPEYVFLLPYKVANNLQELMAALAKNKAEGGEGLMVRWGDCPRKEGKSTMMLKLKHYDDDEFEIVDITDGNGNWTGCAKTIRLKLNKPGTRGDTEFDSNIKGDEEWLRELFLNRKKYIGEQATTEFQHYSEYGIPQLPYVIAIRNYEKKKK